MYVTSIEENRYAKEALQTALWRLVHILNLQYNNN